MANPIWKDYFVKLFRDAKVEYRILDQTGNMIYSGVAFKKPGDTHCIIKLNDLVTFAKASLSLEKTLKKTESAQETGLSLQVLSGGVEWEDWDNYSFLNDWSYDYQHDPERDGLYAPINCRVARNTWLTRTVYCSEPGLFFEMLTSDGRVIELDIECTVGTYVTIQIYIPAYEEAEKLIGIDFPDTLYKVVDTCSRYTLYYVNAYGGWDSFLIEGNHKESDAITRHERDVIYDNSAIVNRGKMNYANEIAKTITLHTSWLSDDESQRMHHLLNSTNVYLYDSVRDEMMPVVISNTSLEYKTYKNTGNSLVSYDIEVKLADRIRR